jgi:hypothetical protein
MNVVILQDEYSHLKTNQFQLETMFEAGVETWEEYDYYKFLLNNKKNTQKMSSTTTNNNTVFVTERDLRIMYNVDMLSTYQIADKFNVDVKQVRNALKNIGVIVRRGETEPENSLRLIVNRLDNTYMNSDGTVYTIPTVTEAIMEPVNMEPVAIENNPWA